MKLTIPLSVVGAGLALFVAAGSAQAAAAPTSVLDGLKQMNVSQSLIEEARHRGWHRHCRWVRRCWWHRGHRHCRRVRRCW